MPPDTTTYAVSNHLRATEMGNWGPSSHFWACLFQVQLKHLEGWNMLVRSSAYCYRVLHMVSFHHDNSGLTLHFSSVIVLCLQSYLSFPGVGRSSNLSIPCRDLLPCRVNSPTTLGHCASTGRMQLPHKATPLSSVLADSVAIPSAESGTSRQV